MSILSVDNSSNQDVKIHVHDFQFPLIVFSYFLD